MDQVKEFVSSEFEQMATMEFLQNSANITIKPLSWRVNDWDRWAYLSCFEMSHFGDWQIKFAQYLPCNLYHCIEIALLCRTACRNWSHADFHSQLIDLDCPEHQHWAIGSFSVSFWSYHIGIWCGVGDDDWAYKYFPGSYIAVIRPITVTHALECVCIGVQRMGCFQWTWCCDVPCWSQDSF